MIYFRIFQTVLLFYVLFIIAPAVVSTVYTFLPRIRFYSDFESLRHTCYGKYIDEIEEATAYIKGLPCRTVSTSGYDGVNLSCDYYENKDSAVTVILFHGFRADPFINLSLQAKAAYENGYSVALVHERGHGKSGGGHTGLGILERHDVITWCTFFRENTNTEKAVLYGISMGCTAVSLACDGLPEDFVKGLVCDCGFTSVYGQMKREAEKRHLPAFLLMPYVGITAKILLCENIKESVLPHIEKCPVPVLFIHGKNDSTVDCTDTEKAYDACRAGKEIIITENAEHALAFPEGGKAMKEKLLLFIQNVTEEK